jgi:CheY-like chemotaxis protein
VDGLDVLCHVKGDPALKTIPAVVLTSSCKDQDIVESYSLGVNAYVVKQVGLFWVLINETPRTYV